MKNIQRILVLTLLSFVILLFTSLSYAKSISLHEQPKIDSKMVGSINSEAGIIPIFTPKESDWIKVADPRNGDVGWIKLNDLSSASGTTTGLTFTQKTVTSGGRVPHTIQIIQFGNPEKLTAEQEKMMKQMKAQQEALQKDMQNMMNDIFKNMNQKWEYFPMVIPMIVVPEQKLPVKAASTMKK